MKIYRLTAPKHIDTEVLLPASKSISNRALIIHALSGGHIRPENLSDCDDTRVMVEAFAHQPDTIDIGAAGTAMRFFTAYLSAIPGDHVITGSERMRHRPIGVLVDALRHIGADIQYMEQDGYPPLHIHGHDLDGGRLDMPGNVSSQYTSALLLIGPVLRNGLKLKLKGEIVSRPYIDLTLSIMHRYGAMAEWTDVDTISVSPGKYADRPFRIENDWSASSYWYETLALLADRESEVRLEGLMDGSRQGDSVVKYLFSLLGVKTTFGPADDNGLSQVSIAWHAPGLARFDYDFTGSPDLAQTLVVTCCEKGIPFKFTGLRSLRIKETDRIAALECELAKLGYVVTHENDDTMLWEGSRCEPSGEPIDTYDDHRMAMALAPCCINHPGLRIRHPEVVSKSYPEYWQHLRQAGFGIEEINE